MATREDTRRELRELAKLAEVIPKERTTIAPPAPEPMSGALEGGSPFASFGAPPVSQTSASQPGFLSPLGPSDSIAPAATSTPPSALTSGKPWGWVVAGGGTLVAAMVGGVLLGQALASHPSSHASTAAAAGATDTRAELSTVAKPIAPTPVAAAAPVATTAPAETANTLVVTDEGAPAVTVRSPRPAHHAVKKTPKAAANHDSADEPTHKASSSAATAN